MRLWLYILFRILFMGIQLFGISILLFLIYAFMNYDPALVHNFLAPPEIRDQLIKNEQELLGTGIPYDQQFWNFWRGLVFGDCETMGEVFSKGASCNHTFGVGWEGEAFGRPIDGLIIEGTFNTMVLFLFSFLIFVIVGISAGIAAGLKPNGLLDFSIRIIANLFVSVPSIIFAIYALRISLDPSVGLLSRDFSNRHEIQKLNFYSYFRDLQTSIRIDALGSDQFAYKGIEGVEKFWIPVMVSGLISSVFLFRLVRGLILKETRMLYVRTAKAKGLTPGQVIVRHIFPNIFPKILNAIAVTIPAAITTTAMVEFVFDFRGLARLMVVSARVVDIPVLLAGSLVLSFLTMIIVIILDVGSIMLDPRRRLNE